MPRKRTTTQSPASRESRDSKVNPKLLLKPFDVSKFGGDEDPCFGKLYSLTADECQVCGDIEICAIAFANAAHLRRAKVESEEKFKDLEEEEILFKAKILEFIKKSRASGKGDVMITILAAKKFNKPKSYIKDLL